MENGDCIHVGTMGKAIAKMGKARGKQGIESTQPYGEEGATSAELRGIHIAVKFGASWSYELSLVEMDAWYAS